MLNRVAVDCYRTISHRARRRLLAFKFAQGGTSAIEFAIIAPVLIVLLLGTSDIVPAVTARYHVDHTNEATGDLIAQYSQMQLSDMVSTFTAASDMLAPYSSATLSIRITNIYSDGNGHAYVYWSCANGALKPYTAKSLVTSTPSGSPVSSFLWLYNSSGNGYILNGTNTSYVMAETQYVYTTPAQFVIQSPLTFVNTAYLTPRESAYVGFPWDGVSTDAAVVPSISTRANALTLSNGAVCSYSS